MDFLGVWLSFLSASLSIVPAAAAAAAFIYFFLLHFPPLFLLLIVVHPGSNAFSREHFRNSFFPSLSI